MSNHQNYSEEKRSAEDRALDRFADMLISKLEGIKADWKKPWFTEGSTTWPKNLDGREYNGMNALVLMMHCEKEGYKLPVFMTFDRVSGLNYKGGRKIGSSQALDKGGNALPQVSVNKGEKSFPVFLTTFTVVDPETKEKIPYDDYKQLSAEERAKYHVFPKLNVYNVFNVSQTNIEQARPELFKKLQAANRVTRPMEMTGNQFAFPAMDHMIANNEWICPIKPTYGDDAYYSISKAEIIIPEKRQFKSGESFYANLAHEMAHSTGAENLLNRLKPTSFGSKEYAREELIAELSAALVSQRFGMDKCIKEDSIPYLKNWLDSLKEDPSYLKTVLVDVKKASSMINQRIDMVQQKLDQGEVEKLETVNVQSSALGSFDIPKWAVPYIVNGDSSGLKEHEVALVDQFIDKHFPDGFVPEEMEGTEKESNLHPAFGEKSDTVTVRFEPAGYFEARTEEAPGYASEVVVDNTPAHAAVSESSKPLEVTAAKQTVGEGAKYAIICASKGSFVSQVSNGIVDFNSLENAIHFNTRDEARAVARECKVYAPDLRFTVKQVVIKQSYQDSLSDIHSPLLNYGKLDIPEWALNYLENGDATGLSDKEVALVDEFTKCFPNGYLMEVDWNDCNEFNRFPAFGERNENALPERGEPALLATKTYGVTFCDPVLREKSEHSSARLSDLVVELRGEQRTPWLSGKVDGEPVVSEKLNNKEFQDYIAKKVSAEDLGLIHFKNYLDQNPEEKIHAGRQL